MYGHCLSTVSDSDHVAVLEISWFVKCEGSLTLCMVKAAYILVRYITRVSWHVVKTRVSTEIKKSVYI
jgi:hypothetical protein